MVEINLKNIYKNYDNSEYGGWKRPAVRGRRPPSAGNKSIECGEKSTKKQPPNH